jgi:competence ComEA-like helix-hairpin-helix protein
MLLLLGLALVGQGVRYFVTRPGEPPGQVQLLGAVPSGSPRAQRDSAVQQAAPLGEGERIDVDRAPAAELSRLPKVGLRLAKIIVADREAHGAFGELAGLDRVAGIGPGLLQRLAPHVAFSGTNGTGQPPGAPASVTTSVDLNSATTSDLDALPGIGPSRAAAILQYREQHGRFSSVDELERVPGFGPAAVSRLRPRLSAR